MNLDCKLPPPGWVCTRGNFHSGPCAAWPLEMIADAKSLGKQAAKAFLIDGIEKTSPYHKGVLTDLAWQETYEQTIEFYKTHK